MASCWARGRGERTAVRVLSFSVQKVLGGGAWNPVRGSSLGLGTQPVSVAIFAMS